MTPIIDPMIFYWIGVCENLGAFLILLAVLSGLAIIITWAVIGINISFGNYLDDAVATARGRKWTLLFSILLIIFGTAAAFTPTKETLYAMTIANCITEDNIEYITEKGEEGVKFIIEQIDTLLEENEKDKQ